MHRHQPLLEAAKRAVASTTCPRQSAASHRKSSQAGSNMGSPRVCQRCHCRQSVRCIQPASYLSLHAALLPSTNLCRAATPPPGSNISHRQSCATCLPPKMACCDLLQACLLNSSMVPAVCQRWQSDASNLGAVNPPLRCISPSMVLCCRETLSCACGAAAPPTHSRTSRDPQLSAQSDLLQSICCRSTCCSEPGQQQHGPKQSLATRLVVPVNCSQPTFYLTPARLLLVATLCRRLWLLGTTRLHSVSCQCHCQQRFVLRLLHEQRGAIPGTCRQCIRQCGKQARGIHG